MYIRGIERKNVMEFMESEVYVRGIERKNVIRVLTGEEIMCAKYMV